MMNRQLENWYLHLLLTGTTHKLRNDLEHERKEYAQEAKALEKQYLPITKDSEIASLRVHLKAAEFKNLASFFQLLSVAHPEETILAEYVRAFHPAITSPSQMILPGDALPPRVSNAITSW